MSRIKGATLVVAMFVMSAIAVASASAALPEFESPYPKHFVGLQLGTGLLETKEGRTVECEHGAALGNITSAKHALVNSITFTKCKSTAFGAGECQSGATKGEIKTNPLLGLLGYINKAGKEVGLLLEPDNAPDFATFNCATILGTEKLLVKGTVVCPLSPANISTDKYHLNCVQSKGVQTPLGFEGGTTDTLMTQGVGGPEVFGFEQSGIKSLSDILTLGLAKINA